MKAFQHKRIILAVAAFLTISFQAFAQQGYVTGQGLKNTVDEYYQPIDAADPSKGYIIKYDQDDTFGKTTRVHGIDDLTVGQLDGHHWNGKTLTAGEDMEGIFLVNKFTGEYLVLGDNFGTTPMQDYTGTMFNLRGGKYCIADKKGKVGGVLHAYQVNGDDPKLGNKIEREGKGYQICLANNEERCIGRKQTAQGFLGGFESAPFMVMRSSQRKEYTRNPKDGVSNPPGNNDDGHFVFYFHPVTQDGKQYYVIYTHRQTTAPVHDSFYANLSDADHLAWQRLPEYGNRDTYLCLKSTPNEKMDGNMVTYKKFAGKMYTVGTSDTHYFFENYSGVSNSATDREPNSTSVEEVGGDFIYAWGADEYSFAEKNNIEGTPENNSINLTDGLATVAQEDACLWKIVTKEERDKYRIVASIDHPYALSYKIENPKFAPYYLPYAQGGVNDGGGSLGEPNFYWNWYDNSTSSSTHEHPYTSGIGTEFHKIGTHYYDRWGWGENGNTRLAVKSNERKMTQGEEADYVGSIYNGSAALRQTITGLRKGRYIVYCRAFYAPLEMKNFDNANGFATDEFDAEGYFTGRNYGGEPTWTGQLIDGNVQAVINAQEQSSSSFFFAISNGVKRKRNLPSIFSGMMPLDDNSLDGLSKYDYLDLWRNDAFLFSALGEALYIHGDFDKDGNLLDYGYDQPFLGHTLGDAYRLMLDETVFGKVKYNGANYFVPRNLAGAARFFSAYDRAKHGNAFNYRIGLPVEVGEDGELTIGIDHVKTDGKTEWVCFDNFELVYYGDAEGWEFIIDESEPANCTRYHDLFDWEKTSNFAIDRRAKVVIKRGLDPSKFVPLVLPISLTKADVKEAFGEGVKISEPSSISYRTIHFTAVSTDGNDGDIAIEAYKPYIVKPSIAAPISATQTWERTGKDNNPFDWSGYNQSVYSNQRQYVPKPGRNDQIVNGGNAKGKPKKSINGPIYFLDGYRIEKAVHYKPTSDEYLGAGMPIDNINYLDNKYNAANQWKPVGDVYVGDEQMEIKGSTDGKTYQLRATCYYDPTDAAGMDKKVPPYSYFFSGGSLKFNGASGSTQQKGFSFYLQIIESEPVETANIITWNTPGNSTAPNGTHSDNGGSGGYYKVFTTNVASGVKDVVISTDYNAMGKGNHGGMRHFAIQASEANMAAPKTFTITAPAGYKIDGYKIGAYCTNKEQETYTLTAEGGKSVTINSNVDSSVEPTYLEVKRLDVASTSFTFQNVTSGTKQWMAIPHFEIRLRKIPEGGSAKVFAGNVGDFEWVPVADGEVTGVAETFREYENPANDLYYDLQGRPVKTPKKNGIYIYRGKKIVY